MNFDRLRHVSESADLGESSEIILGVTIDKSQVALKFCSIIGKRAITEFNYRYSDSKDAQVFVGIKTTKGVDEKRDIIKRLKVNGYKCHDMSSNEMAKLHVRYMVGGFAKKSTMREFTDSCSQKNLVSF